MAYVDTEKVLETARDGCHSDFGRSMADLTSLREVLEDTPTAAVVEVVRCKDCVHFKKDTDYCKEHKKGYCEWDNTIKSRNHFCSYGENALKERERE